VTVLGDELYMLQLFLQRRKFLQARPTWFSALEKSSSLHNARQLDFLLRHI
jgi:hypothetical protein